MASAFVSQNTWGVGDDGTGMVIVFDCMYSGSDVPEGRQFAPIRVNLPSDASPVQIRQQLTNLIQSEPANQGWTFTVPTTGITQPAYNKG